MPLIVNGVEIENLIVINTATGEQVDIETLQDQLGNILFQKQTAPPWFNYTGIDANGNYEGTSAYDGTAVTYGIGKPKITIATDGTENISWDRANGLNADYFNSKYGEGCLDWWGTNGSTTVADKPQVVEDILVMPETYKGKPITTILNSSFYAMYLSISGTRVEQKYQPYYYQSVVFGSNITTIQNDAFCNVGMETLSLGGGIKHIGNRICGTSSNDTAYNYKPALVVNSNITGLDGASGLYNDVEKVTFSANVTEVSDLLNSSTSHEGYVWKFLQAADTPVTITFNSKGKTAQKVSIYTNNNSVKNYDWSTNGNITPTFYPLSSWGGI